MSVSEAKKTDGQNKPDIGGRAKRSIGLARPVTVSVFAIVVVVVGIAGWVVGRNMQLSDEAARLAQATAISVWAPVEERVVAANTSFTAEVKTGIDTKLFMPASALENEAVVLEMGVQPGEFVRSGQLLAVVSGVPYFALPEPLALYRDLKFGDTGLDVESLQTALNQAGAWIDVTGVVDYDTLAAAELVYAAADYHLPAAGQASSSVEVPWKDRVIPAHGFLAVPAARSQVVSVQAPGARLDAETPLLEMKVGDVSVQSRVDVVTADSLKNGQAVTVTVGGNDYAATVTQIGEVVTEDSGESYQMVTVTPSGDFSQVTQTQARITVNSGDGQSQLAVPTNALRTRNDGSSYLIVRSGTGETATTTEPAEHEVPVRALRSDGGYTAIQEAGDAHLLAVGAEVKVL